MKARIIAACVIFVLLLSSFYFFHKKEKLVLSEEDKKMAFDTANAFGECAGFFDATAWLAEKASLEESSKAFKNSYRGWYFAGAYMLFSVGAISDWKKSQDYMTGISENFSQNFKASLESDFKKAHQEMDAMFDKKCTPLVEYQTSLVSEMREKMAKTKEK